MYSTTTRDPSTILSGFGLMSHEFDLMWTVNQSQKREVRKRLDLTPGYKAQNDTGYDV